MKLVNSKTDVPNNGSFAGMDIFTRINETGIRCEECGANSRVNYAVKLDKGSRIGGAEDGKEELAGATYQLWLCMDCDERHLIELANENQPELNDIFDAIELMAGRVYLEVKNIESKGEQ